MEEIEGHEEELDPPHRVIRSWRSDPVVLCPVAGRRAPPGVPLCVCDCKAAGGGIVPLHADSHRIAADDLVSLPNDDPQRGDVEIHPELFLLRTGGGGEQQGGSRQYNGSKSHGHSCFGCRSVSRCAELALTALRRSREGGSAGLPSAVRQGGYHPGEVLTR